MSKTAKLKLRKRLSSYWKLELLSIVLVPAMMIFLSMSMNYKLGPITFFTIIPMCALLFVGGLYWRAKYQALDQGKQAVWRVMGFINAVKWPLAGLSFAALGAALFLWIHPDWSRSCGDQWTATVAAMLAVAEYINYYHRQLQHFDHASDFKRLIVGRGFRRSQLAKDLSAWRREQGSL